MPDYTGYARTRPGYSPATATLKPLRDNASRQLSIGDKGTARRLEDFGISSSDAYEVRIAWRHLQFVNGHDDCVTGVYEGLAHASDNEFKLLLGKILKSAYSDVFDRLAERGVDLDHVTQQEWRDIFRDCQYEPANMQAKMITLFKGLCREAVFEPYIPQEPGQQITGTQSQIARGGEASTALEGRIPDDSMVVAYLDVLEVFRQHSKSLDWTEAESSSWRKAITANVYLLQGLLEGAEPAPSLGLNSLSPKQDDSKIEECLYMFEVLRKRRKSPDWTEAESPSWRKAIAASVNSLQRLLKGKE